MQAAWITRSPDLDPGKRKGVIVFASGWAGSDELVRHLALPQGYDLLCLYDYRTLPSATELAQLHTQLGQYQHRHLIAWSFGVWAAAQVFGESSLQWDSATAINGTPVPISDAYGIPPRAFAVTVRSIGGAGTLKFIERMCGTPEILREYYKHRSMRPLDEIYDELVTLQRQTLIATPPAKNIWTAAVIGGKDAIFPPPNMERYWTEAGVPFTIATEMPHYPLHDPEILTRLIHEAR